jgi:hypothetical protein
LWAKFADVNVSVADVGKEIGGKVEQDIKRRHGVFIEGPPRWRRRRAAPVRCVRRKSRRSGKKS